MELVFKTKNQKQIIASRHWSDDVTEQILYGGGKGGGKSFLGATLIFGDALIYDGTHYFIARKELTDLRKFTIPTVYEVFEKWGIKVDDYMHFNGQDNCFELKNGSKVFLISCKIEPSDPLLERFGSMQMTRGWIEEGGEIDENAKSNLWLSIGRWKNKEFNLKKKLLITANPKKGWMKRDFIVPYREGTLDKTKVFIKALALDNVYLTSDYIDSLKNEKDIVRRQRLWEGDWDYDEDKNSLISSEALSDAFNNSIKKDGEKYLVCDIARLGKDSSVLSYWEGLELIDIEKYQITDTNKIKNIIKDFIAKKQIPYSNVLIDEDGIGGGVVDGLWGVNGFVANSSPIDTRTEIREKLSKLSNNFIPKNNFKNLKSQCGWKIAELINERKIKLPEKYRDEIIGDLSSILKQKDIDSENKKQLISKEDVKREIGHSPDIGDTILMRAFFEIREVFRSNPQVVIEQENIFMRNRNRIFKNSSK